MKTDGPLYGDGELDRSFEQKPYSLIDEDGVEHDFDGIWEAVAYASVHDLMKKRA